MPNTYFDFKQFRVEQGDTGMKVSTDACILGAWVYHSIEHEINDALDIGAGTGLLSLMIGQLSFVKHIDAIEIETAAYNQCQDNFSHAAWSEKLSVHHLPIQALVVDKQYDLIVSNPPFFENHLKSLDDKRKLAFHDDALSKEALVQQLYKFLNQQGKAYVIYPSSEWALWKKAIQQAGELYIKEEIHIYPSVHKPHNRIIGVIQKGVVSETVIKSFHIRNAAHDYSEEFIGLLQPFYLNL